MIKAVSGSGTAFFIFGGYGRLSGIIRDFRNDQGELVAVLIGADRRGAGDPDGAGKTCKFLILLYVKNIFVNVMKYHSFIVCFAFLLFSPDSFIFRKIVVFWRDSISWATKKNRCLSVFLVGVAVFRFYKRIQGIDNFDVM